METTLIATEVASILGMVLILVHTNEIKNLLEYLQKSILSGFDQKSVRILLDVTIKLLKKEDEYTLDSKLRKLVWTLESCDYDLDIIPA